MTTFAVVSRDWMATALLTMAVAGLLLAVVLLVGSWPPGGGSSVSEAAIAQGASLIFVVILLGLLAPAIEAGRSIGWDASWIRNDPVTWTSLVVIAAISLFELWLGSERPERAEEVATIALTASGLAMTGLVARRVIGFADPAIQLAERRRREARTISRLIDSAADQSKAALSLAGIDTDVASPIVSLPPVGVQRAVAESIQRVLATSRMAWHRGEWVLAAQAHVQAIVLAMQYADAVGALSGDDRVFELIRNETDDLHEMAKGPEGRWLSLTILQNLIECAVAVTRTGKAAMPHHESDQMAYYFAMTIESLVRRRLADMKSQDIGAGLSGLKRLALAEVAMSHPWGGASIAKLALKWAAPGVEAGLPHVAWPAWSCGMEVLRAIALQDDAEGLALGSLIDDFTDALGKVSRVPHAITNGLEPIVGHWVADSTLVGLGYSLWQAPENRLEPIADFMRRVSYEIVRLISNTDVNWQRASSKNGGDVLYHLTAAAAVRAEEGSLEEPARSWIDEAIANGMGWLRELLVSDGEVPERYATRDLLHIYLSAWQVALYSFRSRSELPDEVRREHERLMEALTGEVLSELPNDPIREGLGRLAAWLDQEGYVDLSEVTLEKREEVPGAVCGPSPGSSWGWGFGGNYHVYRGSMTGGFFNRVEEYFSRE